MKITATPLKPFGIAIWLLPILLGAAMLVSEPGLAQTKEVQKTAPANTKPDANSDYKVGDRLKPAKPSQRPVPDTSTETLTNAEGKTISFKTIAWEELIPADWDPSAEFKGMDLGLLGDADPRAIAALKKLRSVWDKAPTNPKLNQKQIRIPGFVVPLDIENGKVGAFLLVPYFGGCLHTPPPPANQIIEVQMEKPQAIKTMAPVWVSGQLETVRSQTELGTAGYRLNAVKVLPYKEPARR